MAWTTIPPVIKLCWHCVIAADSTDALLSNIIFGNPQHLSDAADFSANWLCFFIGFLAVLEVGGNRWQWQQITADVNGQTVDGADVVFTYTLW